MHGTDTATELIDPARLPARPASAPVAPASPAPWTAGPGGVPPVGAGPGPDSVVTTFFAGGSSRPADRPGFTVPYVPGPVAGGQAPAVLSGPSGRDGARRASSARPAGGARRSRARTWVVVVVVVVVVLGALLLARSLRAHHDAGAAPPLTPVGATGPERAG